VTLPPSPPHPRSPWQRLYGAAHRARRRWWAGRAARLPRPVISVGNLLWGGGGKTPVTAAVAAHLRDLNHRVAILSRGYGRPRTDEREVVVVSTGDGPLLGPSVAGDEPVLLAGELPGVAVVVAGSRHAAGRHALAHLDPPPDLFVLDDGFSHLSLARDLDLLVFPAADPFAGTGRLAVPGRLPPFGRLREPLSACARADAVLLTGDLRPDPGSGETGAELARALAPHGFRGPGFAAPARLGPVRFPGGRPLDAGPVPVLLVSGIARPRSFAAGARRTAERGEVRVTGELRFPDHHPYPEASLERIRRAYREQGARAVLTTAKDRVKLHGRLGLPLAELPLTAEPEPAFWRWLDERLEGLLP
jgi:tetraacyldisaccharide 4'-kinase